MKFDKQLKAQMHGEWAGSYVNYKFYKKWTKRLCGAMKLSPYTPPVIDPAKPRPFQLTRPLLSEEEEMQAFREFSESEFRKVETFNTRLAEKANAMSSQYADAVSSQSPNLPSLKEELVCFLRDWLTYIVLNKEAFRKSYKKAAKYASKSLLVQYEELKSLAPSLFTSQNECANLIQKHRMSVRLDPTILSDRFDSAPVSASVVLLIAAFLIFFFYYVLTHAEELQLRSGEVTSFLQGHFSNDRSDMISILFHEILGTPFWVLAVSVLLWSVECSGCRLDRIAAHCYFITTVSFVVKSLVKNFLQVPRVFWLYFDREVIIDPSYCGVGYGFPSGHAMVSLTVFAYLLVREWTSERYISFYALLTVTLLYEAIMGVNVVFIGTHTFSEVIGGWIFALMLVTGFLRIENRMLSFLRRPSVKRALVYVLSLTLLTLFFDFVEDQYQQQFMLKSDSDEWMHSMAVTCHQTDEEAKKRIQLHMDYSNTPLIFGLATGYVLWAMQRPSSALSSWHLSVWARKLAFGEENVKEKDSNLLWRAAMVLVGYLGHKGLSSVVVKSLLPKVVRLLIAPVWILIGPNAFFFCLLSVASLLFGNSAGKRKAE